MKKKIRRKKQGAKRKVDNALLNVITPFGMSFEKNKLSIGEVEGAVYGITRFAPTVPMGWLGKITNLPRSVVSIGFTPIDVSEFIEAVSRNIRFERGEALSSKDPLAVQRAENAALDGEEILLQVDRDGETVGHVNVMVLPTGIDEETFKRSSRRAQAVVNTLKCKMRVIPNLQKESFQQISPAYSSVPKIDDILNRVMPLSTLVGGLPFASSGFNDGQGYYFAKDGRGSLVIVDPWIRREDRTNSCFVIMGVPGTGKSTAIKHLILSEVMEGTRVMVIDPESEYGELTSNLNGDKIDAGGGRFGLINPLEIKHTPGADDDESEERSLARHMHTLEVFLTLLFKSLSDTDMAILKKTITELYQNFGISWETDTSEFKSSDFPTFSDLYSLLENKLETENSYIEVYKKLILLMHDITHGANSFLWNGHTSINATSSIVTLDTSLLQEMPDNVKRAQYFNILTYCWHEMSKDRTERMLLVCDEAYLMIDENVPQSLVYLRNAMKRSRKYEGGIAVISHSVVDFLSDSIKQYGQALLDTPCYKILMGSDGQNLRDMDRLYSLTEAEKDLLLAKRRKHALFMAGSKRLHVVFDLPDYKISMMGTAGGR